ncbi:MAG: sigma-70 family RNA polymerase sigma factor [Desulfobacterales bacterium]|nr:sigma-70 family RNA polymerase sigma factor [Desulfobacterales bacterium]
MDAKFRRVDRDRFKQLAFPHLEFLYNIALKYTGRPYDAEDIVQETLYTAFRKFHQLRDDNKCRQWLFSILRTTFLRERQLFKKRPFLDDGSGYLKHITNESADSLSAAIEKKINKNMVQAALDELPEKHKSPLVLFYMEDMTYQEIADLLEIPIGTVMSRLARAKKSIKRVLLKKMGKQAGLKKIVSFSSILMQEVM